MLDDSHIYKEFNNQQACTVCIWALRRHRASLVAPASKDSATVETQELDSWMGRSGKEMATLRNVHWKESMDRGGLAGYNPWYHKVGHNLVTNTFPDPRKHLENPILIPECPLRATKMKCNGKDQEIKASKTQHQHYRISLMGPTRQNGFNTGKENHEVWDWPMDIIQTKHKEERKELAGRQGVVWAKGRTTECIASKSYGTSDDLSNVQLESQKEGERESGMGRSNSRALPRLVYCQSPF